MSIDPAPEGVNFLIAPKMGSKGQLFELRGDYNPAVAGKGMTIEVVLVVFLGLVEMVQGGNLGHNGTRIGFLGAFLRSLRRLPLFFSAVIDGRPVLGSDIVSLAIERGRVVGFPEEIKHPVQAYLVWVKGDEDDLRMPRAAGAHLLVGRIFNLTSGVARHHRFDTLNSLIHRLDAPKAAATENDLVILQLFHAVKVTIQVIIV